MKLKMLWIYGLCLVMFYWLSCPLTTAAHDPIGFFGGLCHGMTSTLLFLFRFFNHDIEIWNAVNNGAGYKIGFMFGTVFQVILIPNLFFKKEE